MAIRTPIEASLGTLYHLVILARAGNLVAPSFDTRVESDDFGISIGSDIMCHF